jgi:hypothetical protein
VNAHGPTEPVILNIPEELAERVQELADVQTGGDGPEMCVRIIWRAVDEVGYNRAYPAAEA